MYCPWCGALVEEEDAKFCPDCGKPLDVDAALPPGGEPSPGQQPVTPAAQQAPASPDAPNTQVGPQTGGGAQPHGASPQEAPAEAPGHPRRAPVYVAAAAVAVAALALGLVVWGVSSGGEPPAGQDASQAQPATGNANATNANATNTDAANGSAATNGASGSNATATAGTDNAQPAQGNAGQAGNANASAAASSAASSVSVTIARLNGWWTTFGNLPYNPYVFFKDGVAYVYSHDGEPEGTWVPKEGRRVWATEFGANGTIISSTTDSDAFYVLRDSGDILDSHWYEDGRLQYSGSDSLTQCGGDPVYAVPSFASAVEAALANGQSQAASQPAADDSFQQQKPTITGWTKQTVPLGDGVIYRCAWTPIDGAEGYELRRWDLLDKWDDFPLQTLTSAYYDCGSSDSVAFGAQVRGYKTVGGSRVYTQWSDRSNFEIPEHSLH